MTTCATASETALFPAAADRLATVADFAQELCIATRRPGLPPQRQRQRRRGTDLAGWIAQIRAANGQRLVCGTCSRALVRGLLGSGLVIHSHGDGSVDAAVERWCAGFPGRRGPGDGSGGGGGGGGGAGCGLRRRRRRHGGQWLEGGASVALTDPSPEATPAADGAAQQLVAIAASAQEPSAPVDARFGRAPWFLLVDPAAGSWSSYANPHADGGSGVGAQVAAWLAELGATDCIAGAFGPKVVPVLDELECRAWVAGGCSAEAALDVWRAGSLTSAAG